MKERTKGEKANTGGRKCFNEDMSIKFPQNFEVKPFKLKKKIRKVNNYNIEFIKLNRASWNFFNFVFDDFRGGVNQVVSY